MKTLVLSLMMISFAQAAHAACGTFEVSKGDVKVQPVSGASRDAAVGSKICAGETVVAGQSARAKIQMEDGNELNVSPNSKIVIETYQYDVASNKKKVMLNVLRGKVRATTREENMYNDKAKDGQANTFQIRTKSAVAGVRGTDFLTSFDVKTNKMEVVTFRGKVEVGQLNVGGTITNSVFVAVGQKTVVVGGQAPSIPKALPAGELMKQNVETHNESPGSASSGPAAGAGVGASAGAGSGGDSQQPSEPAAGSGSGSAAAPSTASQPVAGSGGSAAAQPSTRTPAAATGGSMISTGDLPASSGGPVLPKMPVAPAPPQVPAAVLNNNIIINNTIQNRKSTVNLNLHVK
jgi:hypothetical protein